MRVTSQYLYNNFKQDQQKVNQGIKKISEQISSGKIIDESFDDSKIYSDTLRLDTHIHELKDIQDRTTQAQHFTSVSDTVLSQFDDSLTNIKTKLIAAANAPMNQDNREAIAKELEGEKEYLRTLANTKVGNQYIFSGSATATEPIDEQGTYHGNEKSMTTVVGSGISIENNISGQALFLGSDENVNKALSTNVQLRNQDTGEIIEVTNSIGEMTGNKNDTVGFFLSGTSHDGSAFKNVFIISPDESIDTLLSKIGEEFGNTSSHQNVNVELNDNGNITVTDLKSGKSQLDLKLFGEQNGQKVELIKSDFQFVNNTIDDSAYFAKEGATLTGNVVLMANGELANDTSKLSEIANGSLDGKIFNVNLTNINGVTKTLTINLDAAGSTFDGYNVYNADGTQTSADDMTIGQLNNIIAMEMSDVLPATHDKAGFDAAIVASSKLVDVDVNQSGELQIKDKSNDLSQIAFAMYDNDADDYSTINTPSISFMSNNALTAQKAEINFFTELDDIIETVRSGRVDLDGDAVDPRSIGIEKSINRLDQFGIHFNTQQAKVGSLENALTNANEKATMMEISVTELKSELTDVDIAESYMNLNALSLNYQAILSSVTKINSLTLLNYMK